MYRLAIMKPVTRYHTIKNNKGEVTTLSGYNRQNWWHSQINPENLSFSWKLTPINFRPFSGTGFKLGFEISIQFSNKQQEMVCFSQFLIEKSNKYWEKSFYKYFFASFHVIVTRKNFIKILFDTILYIDDNFLPIKWLKHGKNMFFAFFITFLFIIYYLKRKIIFAVVFGHSYI